MTSEVKTPTESHPHTSITGHAAGCVFVLAADGALSLRRAGSVDQEAIAIDLSAAEVIALRVFCDAVDLDQLMQRMALGAPFQSPPSAAARDGLDAGAAYGYPLPSN